MTCPPVLGFAAYSGTGKTQLLTLLIPLLKQHGLRVGVIKHSHHDFEIDHPNKDSYKLRAAGASPTMIVSPYRRAVIVESKNSAPISLSQELAIFPSEGLDIVLVEGFRHEVFPKIEIHRPSLAKALLFPQDENIIAIASDQPIPTPASLACLDLNAPETIADFIIHNFLSASHEY